ncbi:MFS transporter [Mycobacterium sp. CBMA247]|nr:MFS transporter [Mycolicibacterium sp. CBMA 329]MUL85988.1 MFS transporter [Mycolicibacterium sp. CBMA 331]MUM00762.1 MFS transporter [Mycolicibacterium sp. CBMA 334]MUM36284.1 MFS transporter [Mycolicibacterium sp. CBMA 247]MUM42052.1 MFS transporter [Mycolicibacterium sp. CBMA 294]
MRNKSLNGYEHDLELELDGAVEVRPAAMAAGGALLVVAVILTALNLRPAITSIGPVLGEMRESLGASAVWAGALTTLPGLCFAAAGLAAPWLARRIGLGRAISIALVILSVGLVIRVLDGPYVVIGGTLVATAGIALVNVLIPVVIKGSFPAQIGVMTGIYTAALQGGGALGSAITPLLEPLLGGWRGALGAWALVAVVALLFWLVGARGISQARIQASASGTAGRSLLRSPLAWTVTLFFGCQAFLAYIVMGWLPEVFIDNGVSKTNAGLLLGLLSILAVPISLLVPPLAARQKNQSGWIVGLGVVGIIGMIGLLVDPGAAPLLWSVFVGVGMSVFSLALTVIALRARNAEDTARLSGMVQGFGYLLAGVGPFLFGLLHEVTGSWTAPWAMALVVYLVQMVAGALAGRNRYV